VFWDSIEWDRSAMGRQECGHDDFTASNASVLLNMIREAPRWIFTKPLTATNVGCVDAPALSRPISATSIAA
jgi:hypothetical protein